MLNMTKLSRVSVILYQEHIVRLLKKTPKKQQQNPHNLYVIIETSVGLFMVQVIVKRQQ